MTNDTLPKYLKFVSVSLNDLISLFSLDDWPPEVQDYFVELNGKGSITGYELLALLMNNGYEPKFISDMPIIGSSSRTKTIYHFFKKENEIPINVDNDVENI